MEYRVGNVDRKGLTPAAHKDEALNKLRGRAKNYMTDWKWKRHGKKYGSYVKLATVIDRIEQDMWDERKDSDLDTWIIRNPEGVRLFIAETELMGPAPSVGTCPLVHWHKAAWGKYKGLFTRGIYACRLIGGTSSPSQHSYANAEDPAHNEFSVMQDMFDWTVDNEQEFKVAHAIFNRKIWSYNYGYIRPYTGENPHLDHMHVDFLPNLDGACRASTCKGA